MRKTFITMMLLCAALGTLWAVPALKDAVKMQQPDGSYVTIRLHGDEYLHFTTTDDGYSVVKDHRGYYVYARLEDGQLAATDMIAHDAEVRTAAEQSYLSSVKKYQAPEMTAKNRQWKSDEQARQQAARQRAARKEAQYNYNNFRGLLILVEFNDKSFSRSDYPDIINNMVNQEGYTGYTATNGRQMTYTGSVRDYFSDNSMGLFKPEFDVYGPYKIDYSQYDAQGTENAAQLIYAAINAADEEIDFSQYDRDGDNMVDMIYFIFAGNGSNYGGNDSRLYWPHRSVVYNPQTYRWVIKDGVYLNDYASSVELFGYTAYPSTMTIDGIGTICHEFGHVLGLPDFYDTDYEESGGESHHPNEWSIMAGGSYKNNGRTPVGYTLMERSFVGFTTPELLTEEGDYQLSNLAVSGNGYRLNTRNSNEYFLLENRQIATKWDRYLPGHGMLVTRVEENNDVWSRNQVNCNPNHNYFEVVRAKGYVANSGSGDPFPGTGRVTALNNVTSPANLKTWSGLDSPFGIANITEQSGIISFHLEDVNILTAIALPQEATVNVGFSLQLTETRTPDYAPYTITWESANPEVATVSDSGLVTGVSTGEVLITATAVNTRNESLSASCLVAVTEAPVIDNIATFNLMNEADAAILSLNNAQVLYVHQGNTYLRDASGAAVFTGKDLGVQQGDIIQGSILASHTVTDRIPFLQAIDNVDYSKAVSIVGNDAIEPRPLVLAEKSDADYADYVELQAVKLERVTTGLTGVYAVDGDVKVRLFNTFGINKGISVPSNYNGKFYNVPGILVTRKQGNVVYDELALLASVAETTPSAISSITESNEPETMYTLDGRQVTSNRQRGIYIVKTGDKVRLQLRK